MAVSVDASRALAKILASKLAGAAGDAAKVAAKSAPALDSILSSAGGQSDSVLIARKLPQLTRPVYHLYSGQPLSIGGTSLVDKLPAVDAKATKLGEFGVFDNNLSAMGRQMRQRIQRAGAQSHVAFVSQTTDPVDQATVRELDNQGKVPYQKLGNLNGSDPQTLQDFVQNRLFGATGGMTTGAHDLLLENHGGASFGWGQTQDPAVPFAKSLMTIPATMDAIAKGMPVGQKLRLLMTNMCMTGGSAETAVEASQKGVAQVLLGSEDLGISGGFHEDRVIKILNANPNGSAEDLAKQILKAHNPAGADALDLTLGATN
ncbi:MAG: hypothetical protein KGR26_14935, partial [Cyanobacteria bacterium REEB65]|nr:hypothetical protein [Cyanobacteria bacterium REEB65]